MTTTLYNTVGDYGYVWTFNLTNSDGSALDLTSATGVSFKIQLQGSTSVTTGIMSISSPATGGVVTYTVASTDFPIAGNYNAEIEVATTGSLVTFGDITITASDDVPFN